MNHDYTAFGMSLDAGSWAEWVSGAMSFAAVVTALIGYWVIHLQRASDDRKRDVAAAHGAFWKALEVHNHIANIAKHFREGLDSIVAQDKKVMKFTRIRPLNIPTKHAPELSTDEVNFLMRSNSADILMKLSESIIRYDLIRFAMAEYKTRHESFFELMPSPVEGDGERFTHMLSPEQHEKVLPYALMMDKLLDSITELLSVGVKEGESLLGQFEPKMRTYFGKWGLKYEGNSEAVDLSKYSQH